MHHITGLPSVLVSLFCLLLLFKFLVFCVQGSLEHCLHQYHLLSLLLSTVCCLDLLVMFFVFHCFSNKSIHCVSLFVVVSQLLSVFCSFLQLLWGSHFCSSPT